MKASLEVILLFATLTLCYAELNYGVGSRQNLLPAPRQLTHDARNTDKEAKILHQEQDINEHGDYHYAYETSNGISRSEQGTGGHTVHGSSSYISPEGVEIKLTYVADETGYHPVGDHIPKTPDYILRALEYIRTHPYQVKDYYTGATKKPVYPAPTIHKIDTNMVPPTARPRRPRRLTPPPVQYRANNYASRGSARYFK